MIPNRKNVIKKPTAAPGPSSAAVRLAAAGQKRGPLLPNASSTLAKKQRMDMAKAGSSALGGGLGSTSTSLVKLVEVDSSWMECVKDFNLVAKDFASLMKMAKEKGKGRTVKVICGAIKTMVKGDEPNAADLALLKEAHQALMEDETLYKNLNIYGAVFALMNKVETQASQNGISFLPIAIKIVKSFEAVPISLFNFTLFDSMGLRLWVDKQDAANILVNAFSLVGETEIPSDALFDILSDSQAYSFKNFTREKLKFEDSSDQNQALLKSTLAHVERSIDSGATKNLLKTLCLFCGNDKFRLLAAKKLDQWLMNIKTQRQAMELLLFIVTNTKDAASDINLEILGYLTRVKLQKSKQLQIVFQAAIKVILNDCPSGLKVLAEFVLENEFNHTNKAQTNLGFFQFLFSHDSKAVLRLVADKLVRRLEHPEAVKSVRSFVRDLFRSIKDFPYSLLAKEMIDFTKGYVKTQPFSQSLIFRLIVDICTMLPFVSASTAVKEAAQTRRAAGNMLNYQNEVLNRFQQQLQKTQLELLGFIKWAAKNLTLDNGAAINAVGGVLFLKPHSFYTAYEAWPSEPDFNNNVRLFSECMVDEQLIVALIGLNGTITPSDVISVLDNVTRRALTTREGSEIERVLNVNSESTILQLFQITAIDQSPDSNRLAHKLMYWKCWEIVFLWACMNPALLAECFEKYTTLKMLITMAITRDFTFPLPSLDGKSKEQILAEDVSEQEIEWTAIRQLEVQDETEENSNSEPTPSQNYCFLKLTGPCRTPPEGVLKNIEKLNKEFELGTQLSGLRQPDLLEKLAKEQGPLRVLPSLIALLNARPDFIDKIPLSTLAQLYLVVVFDQKMSKPIDELSPNLAGSRPFGVDLQNTISTMVTEYLQDPKKKVDDCKIVLLAMTEKLSGPLSLERDLVSMGLNMIFKTNAAEMVDFDPKNLKTCPHFDALKEDLCRELAGACALEKKNERIMYYMQFIVENIGDSTLHRAAPRLSSLVERSNTHSEEHRSIRKSLMNFFADLIKKLKNSSKSAEEDTLNVTLVDGATVNIDAQIVAAILELLCESSDDFKDDVASNESRQYLMDTFFPKQGQVQVLNAKNEPVDLLSQKLRMKMLSAKDERIVIVALSNITPNDALKYIQSFALTPFSCTELLNRLNLSDVAKSEEARMAVPFIKAYKVRGAKGADKFLKSVEDSMKSQNQELKMELDEEERPVLFQRVESPGSVFSCRFQARKRPVIKKSNEIKTQNEMKIYLNSLLNSPSAMEKTYLSNAEWILAMKAMRKVEMAKETLDFVKNNVEKLMDLKHLLYPMVSACCLTNKQNKNQLGIELNGLAKIIEQKYSNNQVLKAILACSMKTTPFEEGRNKVSEDVNTLSADDILIKLAQSNQGKQFNELTITALVERYMILNPQVVDHKNPTEMDKQLQIMFSSDSVACKHLIALITTTRTPQVTITVLRALLEKFRPHLKPLNILDFVENALKSTSRICLGLEADHLLVLLDYVFAEITSQINVEDVPMDSGDVDLRDQDFRTEGIASRMSRESRLTSPSRDHPDLAEVDAISNRLHQILEDAIVGSEDQDMADHALRKVFYKIKSKIEQISISSEFESGTMKKRFEKLLRNFDQKFPRCKNGKLKNMDGIVAGVTLDWKNDLTVEQMDIKLHWNLKELFELSAVPTNKEVDLMVRQVREQVIEFVRKYPEVFSRQIPLLIHQVQTIIGLTPRQFREVDRFGVLRLILDLIQIAAPCSFERTEELHVLAGSYLSALTKQTSRSRQWVQITESFLRLITNFMETNPNGATQLVEKNKPEFEAINEAYKDNQAVRDFVEAFPLIFEV
ncbi:unnamed protein product [Bursaphelenchus xylophilus]|uniref:(pine wood nematode) hypothetical protein n=1 Tax=Bursaphelenchus xylophilus TaxID=6326 RepID=A0A1I7RKU5_BURXY|nr:unnamed protein product [Bursaphelenchus xylophilus]CAG9131098.1 unnamed protein product [Bursaphelenchus xylophilus]